MMVVVVNRGGHSEAAAGRKIVSVSSVSMNVGHGGDAAPAVLRSKRRRCQNQISPSTILADGRE